MLSNEQIIFKLILAAALGSVVGLERERLDWAAGLRTHMLVCLGSSLFMIVSSYGFMGIIDHPHVNLDPSRVAAQVVSGIGFLGAGTIMFRRDAIRGLTTAASLWAVAAVGLAVGGGLYLGALFTTMLILLILAGIKPVERRLFQNRRPRTLKLVIEKEASLFDIEATIEAADIAFKHIIVRHGESPNEQRLEVLFSKTPQKRFMTLIDNLSKVSGVKEVNYVNPENTR